MASRPMKMPAKDDAEKSPHAMICSPNASGQSRADERPSEKKRMGMTKLQFDTAVQQLQQNRRPDGKWLEIHARIVTAACFVIKQRQGLLDDAEWTVPPERELLAMVREFLDDLSAIQRNRLKRIAKSLRMETRALH